MTVIGSAYVNIRAITTELERDIRKTVEAIKDTITIKVDADVTAATAKIDAVAAHDQTIQVGADTSKAIADMRTVWSESLNATIDVNANTEVAHAEFEHMRDDMDGANVGVDVNLHDAFARARLALLTKARTLRVEVKADAAPLAKIGNYFNRLSGLRVATGHAKELVHEFANIDKAVPAIAMMAVKLGTMAGAAISAFGGILTLGASLGNLIQMIGFAAPGMLAGFAVGIGTLMVALKDFGKQLPDVAAAYKGLSGVIRQNFWATAREPIRDMAMTLLPLFKKGLAETSTSLGGWASSFAFAMKQSLTPDTLSFMFGNLKRSIDIASNANGPFIGGMIELGKVGSALLPQLAQWWVDVASKFQLFVEASVANGNMAVWIQQGITALKQLGRIVSDVAAIFSELTGAAQLAGSDGLGTLVKGLDKIRDALNSPEGARALITIFQGAAAVSGPLIDAIGKIFGALGNAAPAIKSAFESVGAVVGLVGDALSKIISDPAFQAGFTAMFDGIQKGAEALIPVLGTTGPKIGALLSIIGGLAANIGGILGKALEVTLPFITAFKQAIDPLIPILGDALMKIIAELGPTFAIFAKAISDVAPAIAVVVKWVADLVVGLVQTLGPALPGIIAAIAAFMAVFTAGTAIMNVVKTVKTGIETYKLLKTTMEAAKAAQIAFNISALANPWVLLIAGIAALIAGVVVAYNNIGWFKDFVDQSIGMMVDMFKNLGDFWNSNIVPMWNDAMSAAGDFFGAIGTWVGDALGAVGDFFDGFGKGAGDASGAMGDFFGGIGSGISDTFNGAVGFVTDTINNISTIISTIVGNIVTNWTAAWQVISDVFAAVWNGLVWFFQPIVDLILAIIKGFIGIVTAIWTAFWEIIFTIFRGIWENLVRFFTPIIDGIRVYIETFIQGVQLVWGIVWQSISDFFVAIWNNLVAFITPIVQAISDTITSVVNGIVSVWNGVWQGIGDFFTMIWNSMVAFYGPILQGIADFIGAVGNEIAATWNTVWQGISDFFTGVWNGIVAFVSPIIQSISDTITSVVTGIQNNWDATWNAISNVISIIWSGIVSAVSGFVSDVQNNISNFLGDVGRIGSDILGAIGDFPSLLINAGRDLINGLTQGIESNSNAVIDKIKEIANGALDAIKNFFGIKSPSRVMRDQVGKQIGAGLAIGIEQSVGRVSKAVATLSEAAMMSVPDIALPNIVGGSATASSISGPVLSSGTMSGAASGVPGALGGFGAAGGNTVVNFQVNPSAGLNEEQIGESAMNSLFWKLSTQI